MTNPGYPPRGGTVVVAGATGFVGWALARFLAWDYRVVGLSRLPPRNAGGPPQAGRVEWRSCDLFSLKQTETALDGAQHAFYMVHSMLPSARLTQGSFADMDLICADNFARAAAKAGVRQIVYLGGLIPEDPRLSAHLASRLEVEQTLGSRGVPVSALRAGIVIGPFGSSYRIFRTLVERVPIIPCPAWTNSLTQPVGLDDVLALLRWCLEHPSPASRGFDIGSPDVMSYRELLERTAKVMGLRRAFIPVPVKGTMFCQWWLAGVTGTPRAMLSPLLDSIRHSMVARDRRLQEMACVPGVSFEAAVRSALARERASGREEHPPMAQGVRQRTARPNDVRSVQRMVLPPGLTARGAAELYSAWLPRFFKTFLRAEVDADRNIALDLAFPRVNLVNFKFWPERTGRTDRQVFIVEGGIFGRKVPPKPWGRPRVEFREALGGKALLVAIHDYRPALPWFLYNATQALVHLWVMRAFARYLASLAAER
ncbi:MAG: NAD-dependent epimerase/dehydratase family protein [Elusimicrobia bacterium]|nr:NAD-dependent epimerase/dehydratase family protein [Elusimicrobiota bacterium]